MACSLWPLGVPKNFGWALSVAGVSFEQLLVIGRVLWERVF